MKAKFILFFLVFLTAPLFVFAKSTDIVTVTLEPDSPTHIAKDGTIQYWENEQITLNVYFQATLATTALMAFRLYPMVLETNLPQFSFVDKADLYDSFFKKTFDLNKPYLESKTYPSKYYQWLMQDTLPTATKGVPVPTLKTLVGKITAQAGSAGSITINLDPKSALIITGGLLPDLAPISFQAITINIKKETCGDNICSFAETPTICPDDCGCDLNPSLCTSLQVCYNKICEEDHDEDKIPDKFEETSDCTTLGNNFVDVYKITELYAPGKCSFLGCLLGDINKDNHVNGDDVTPFIIQYREASAGVLGAPGQIIARADITQDGKIDGSDITPFIIQYRLNNA